MVVDGKTHAALKMDNPFIESMRKLIRQIVDDEFETLFADNIEDIVSRLVPMEVSAYLHKAFKQEEFGDTPGIATYKQKIKQVNYGPRPRCDMIGCGMHGDCKKKQTDGSWKCRGCGK